MEHIDLYKKLAARMNEGVMVDAPVTNSLLKILMLLFNPDEAEIAAKLPFKNVTLADAKNLYPNRATALKRSLTPWPVGERSSGIISPGRGNGIDCSLLW